MKKVCVITGTRAEYGLLYWTMKSIEASSTLDLQVVVTGMHLDEKFGSTWKQIENDGFKIDYIASLGELSDSRESVLNQISKGIQEFTKAFIQLQPDMIVVLGDRYELLAVAQTALILDIPIAHTHGGEVTEGAFDDSIRHAVTKMSYLHFTASERYRERVIQLGESPDRVYNVGAPGIENFNRLKLFDKAELEKSISFEISDENLLVTYHPVTAAEEQGVDHLIAALHSFHDVTQIITMPNSDPGHSYIAKKWEEYAKNRPNVLLSTSLGQLRYLSAMKHSSCVVGNSSSGIIEAPFCGVPTVNIGSRQQGRQLASTVIQVDDISVDAIYDAISNALKMKVESQDLFGDGQSADKIVSIINRVLGGSLPPKSFYDL